MMRLPGLFAVMIFAASCQTYDFERVIPLAVAQTTDNKIIASKRLKPNVMLLVDNSGSMSGPTNPAAPGCNGCGSASNACPSTCPTRISELRNAMNTFLSSSGTIARFGVTKFPIDLVCGPANSVNVKLPDATPTDDNTAPALTAKAQETNAFIQALHPEGGTPTGSSLAFLGTYAELTHSTPTDDDFRDDFVLLLTDGLPNCSDSNAHNLCAAGSGGVPAGTGCSGTCSMAQNDACACTLGTGAPSSCTASFCAKGCLDQDGAVANVKALRLLGIRTIVVGFGADAASGNAPAVLNSMAQEGGFARSCPMDTDAECGGAAGSCNTTIKQCTTSFFQAANAADLTAALQKISQSFQGDPCVFALSAQPSDPRYLSVVINGQSVAEGAMTYSYDYNSNKVTFLGSNKVTFLGALCTQLNSSTPQHPVSLEFRIVERF